MAKKKSSCKPAPKSTTKPFPLQPEACANGGQHEWEQEDGGTYCKKCHEAAPAKKTKGKVAKPEASKKLSAIDAAAKVLAENEQPMNAKQMVEAMASKKYWTSPGGKTPQATLYSAILTEITKKGKEARFVKTERGHFAANA